MNIPISTRSIAFIGGKGGVGLTSIVLNLANTLEQLHKSALVYDASHCSREMEAYLGISFRNYLNFSADHDVDNYITAISENFSILPCSINCELDTAPTIEQQYGIISLISTLNTPFDYFFVEIPSCMDRSNFLFASAADEIIFIIDETPTSYLGAFWIIQTFVKKYHIDHFGIIVNRATSKSSSSSLFSKLSTKCFDFSEDIRLTHYGGIYKDNVVTDCIVNQKLIRDAYPDSKFNRSMLDVATNIDSSSGINFSKGNIEVFPKFSNL